MILSFIVCACSVPPVKAKISYIPGTMGQREWKIMEEIEYCKSHSVGQKCQNRLPKPGHTVYWEREQLGLISIGNNLPYHMEQEASRWNARNNIPSKWNPPGSFEPGVVSLLRTVLFCFRLCVDWCKEEIWSNRAIKKVVAALSFSGFSSVLGLHFRRSGCWSPLFFLS